MNVHFDHDELNEVRAAVALRRGELDKVRKKLRDAELPTTAADMAIEINERVQVAIGDEPEDLFSGMADSPEGDSAA